MFLYPLRAEHCLFLKLIKGVSLPDLQGMRGNQTAACVRLFAVCCSSQPAVPGSLIFIQADAKLEH